MFSRHGGIAHLEEIENFSQPDLNENFVMVLDACSVIWVWTGLKSKPAEAKAVPK